MVGFFGYVLIRVHPLVCNLVSLSHLQLLVKSSQKHQSFLKTIIDLLVCHIACMILFSSCDAHDHFLVSKPCKNLHERRPNG
jgi:hypothetical protein